MKQYFLYLLFLLNIISLNVLAQDTVSEKTSMGIDKLNPENLANAGLLYENGKIYVVLLVLLTIFAGLIIYLVRLEIKIKKIEQAVKNQNI